MMKRFISLRKTTARILSTFPDQWSASVEQFFFGNAQHFRQFVEQSPHAVAMFDTQMRYLLASQRWLSDFKLKLEWIKGKSHYAVFPEIPTHWKKIHQRCLAGATEKSDGEAFVRTDGSVNWIRWEVRPWYTRWGKVGGILMFSEEISSLIHVRDDLSKWKYIFENAAWGISLISPENHFIAVNQAFAKMHGAPPEEWVGKHFSILFTDDFKDRLPKLLEQFQSSGHVVYESVHVRSDGSQFPVHTEVTAFKDDHGNTTFRVSNFQDISERKKSEEALKNREHRLNAVVANSPSALSVKDLQGRYLIANPNFDKILGMSSEYMIRKTDFDIFPLEVAKILRENDLKVIETQERNSFEEVIPKSNGSICVFMSHKFPIFDVKGKVESVCSISLDITLRKQIEADREQLHLLERSARQRAEASERKFFSIYQNAPIAINLARFPSFVIIDANPEFLKLFGYTLQEVIGKNGFELRLIPDRDLFHSIIEQLAQTHSARNIELAAFNKNGDELIISNTFNLIELEGEPFVFVTSEDITQRKIAERELRFQLKLNETITDNAASCLFMMDSNGHPTFMNPAAKRVTGYQSLSEIKDRPLHYAVHWRKPDGSLYPMEECPIDNAQATLQPVQDQEEIFCRKDGTLFPVSYSVAPLEKDGKVVGSVLEFRDISEQKKIENALHEAIRTRDTFLTIASHELKTPLTSLKLQTQLFNRSIQKYGVQFLEPEKTRKLTSNTIKQVNRLNRLVDDMLDISRIRTGRLSIQPEVLNLGELIQEVLDRMALNFDEAGCEINLQIKGHIEGVWDRARLEQVIINILTNALRYGPGKPIELRAQYDENRVLIHIQDSGIGIAGENLERIFGQFERAISENEVSGFGLGLFISRQIVEAHGGRIWVESHLGHGSTFVIELPLVSSEASVKLNT
jgi:PAS domain S-box-containing protein